MSITGKKAFISSIRTKLILIISIIVIFTSISMIVLAVLTFKGDNEIRIQESNLGQARMVARMVRSELYLVIKELKGIQSFIESKSKFKKKKDFISKIFLSKESSVIYVGIINQKRNSYKRTY